MDYSIHEAQRDWLALNAINAGWRKTLTYLALCVIPVLIKGIRETDANASRRRFCVCVTAMQVED